MSYFRTAMLLAGLTALFMGVGYLIGGASGATIALVIAAATNLFAYWNSDRMVLSMYGAQEVDAHSAPELVDLVAMLAGRAGLPMPRVFLMDNPQPNAFATGRNPQNAAVAVTTGLVQSLSRDELAGVIAHELAHIKNHDTLLMTITATIAGAISMVAQFGMFFGGNRGNNQGPGIIGSIAMMNSGAARRHAGADGDQPHPRICRRRPRRAHCGSADGSGVRAGQDLERRARDPERGSRTQSGDRAHVHHQPAVGSRHGQFVLDPSVDREPNRRAAAARCRTGIAGRRCAVSASGAIVSTRTLDFPPWQRRGASRAVGVRWKRRPAARLSD